MHQPRLRSTTPVFLMADVAATLRWYQAHLGFTATAFPDTPPHAFAVLMRDDVEIMLQLCDGYQKPDLYATREGGVWDAHVRMTGVRELSAAVAADGAVTVLEPIRTRRYGDTEFVVRDLNGYVPVFSERA